MESESENVNSCTSHRSLDDFIILYDQLLEENVCLLIPHLIYVAVERYSSEPNVPSYVLENWLYDVLSGCRRGGYYVTTIVDMSQSKSMEAFLFERKKSFRK